jgi:hypothetical protein
MLGRIAAAAALIALAGCAGMESAGRNASRGTERVANAPAPAPADVAPPPPSAPAPSTLAPPSAVASAPPPAASTQAETQRPITTAARSDEDEDDATVVVPGVRERQVQPPNGDPRSSAERMQDIRAWDQCVMRVQSAAEADPMSPQLDTPEDYCSQSLGMSNRTAIPQSRLERR